MVHMCLLCARWRT